MLRRGYHSAAAVALIVDGLPGSRLDLSASGSGTTSRMGLDATRGPGFERVRVRVSDRALSRTVEILAKADR